MKLAPLPGVGCVALMAVFFIVPAYAAVEPTTGCEDTILEFIVGGKRNKDCAWVAENVDERCNLMKGQVKSFCPVTCGVCDTHACKNPKRKFIYNGNSRNCKWVKKRKSKRCKYDGIASTCRAMCSKVCNWPSVEYASNPCTDVYGLRQCQACTGDCDKDSDCAGRMRCAQRYAETDIVENIPGCRWDVDSDDLQFDSSDYCEYFT